MPFRNVRIKVTSTAFSSHVGLRERLLSSFPDAHFNELGTRIAPEKLVPFLSDAHGVILGLDNMDARVIDQLDSVEIIAKYGVGLDNIDVGHARLRGKVIGWTPGVNRHAVAEMTVAFMIGLLRNIFQGGLKLKAGLWDKNGGLELSGRTVGLIGAGNIGAEVLRLLQPFHCTLLVNDIVDKGLLARSYGARQVHFDEILSESDIISLHVPLTEQTANLFDFEQFKRMKRNSFLINTSRAPIVVQSALKRALQEGVIGGAASDVFSEEPPADRELIELPNHFATPHIGGNSREAVEAMGMAAIAHLESHFAFESGSEEEHRS